MANGGGTAIAGQAGARLVTIQTETLPAFLASARDDTIQRGARRSPKLTSAERQQDVRPRAACTAL
jgi:hypothetical protein